MKEFKTIVLIAVLITPGFAKADTIIDQYWDTEKGGGSHSIYYNAGTGQEFTPTLNNTVGIEIPIEIGDKLSGEVQPITLKLREDTILGNIVASSTILPDPYDSRFTNSPHYGWFYFDFGDIIPLNIGSLYVIDVSVPAVGSINWAWNNWDGYEIDSPGRIIINNEPQEPIDGFCLNFGFREYAVPEPATLLLLGLGAMALRRNN